MGMYAENPKMEELTPLAPMPFGSHGALDVSSGDAYPPLVPNYCVPNVVWGSLDLNSGSSGDDWNTETLSADVGLVDLVDPTPVKIPDLVHDIAAPPYSLANTSTAGATFPSTSEEPWMNHSLSAASGDYTRFLGGFVTEEPEPVESSIFALSQPWPRPPEMPLVYCPLINIQPPSRSNTLPLSQPLAGDGLPMCSPFVQQTRTHCPGPAGKKMFSCATDQAFNFNFDPNEVATEYTHGFKDSPGTLDNLGLSSWGPPDWTTSFSSSPSGPGSRPRAHSAGSLPSPHERWLDIQHPTRGRRGSVESDGRGRRGASSSLRPPCRDTTNPYPYRSRNGSRDHAHTSMSPCDDDNSVFFPLPRSRASSTSSCSSPALASSPSPLSYSSPSPSSSSFDLEPFDPASPNLSYAGLVHDTEGLQLSNQVSSHGAAAMGRGVHYPVVKEHVGSEAITAMNTLRRRHDAPFMCTLPSCTRTFTTRKNCEKHMDAHYARKNHMCPAQGCGRSFTRRDDFKRHEKTHEATRQRFQCSNCLKSYCRKDVLQTHQRHSNCFLSP